MSIEILDPTYAENPDALVRPTRLDSMVGATVGLLSNGKQGTVTFFDAFEQVLREQHGVANVVRVTKGNYSAPAETEIMDQAQTWHALVAGIGD